MRNIGLVALLCVFSTVALAELSEKIQKKLESADLAYKSAVDKADNARFYALQKANGERLKVLKQALTEATKAGDFDGATEIKKRVEAAEAGIGRAQPKDAVKFGGHEYAILTDKATWHSAKRKCEEMGGHLVTFEAPQEQAFVLELCRQRQANVWIGLSNEENLKQWVWVTGQPAELDRSYRFDDPERESIAGCMMYWQGYGTFTDWNLGAYMGFVCEWDK